jgi:hypothetical protein
VNLIPVVPDGKLYDAIERVRKKAGGSPAWYVIQQIYRGNAGAFLFDEVDTYIVVERLVTDVVTMHVWIISGSPGPTHIAEMVSLVDDLAKRLGANTWKMESPRKGWARALQDYVKPARVVYERILK